MKNQTRYILLTREPTAGAARLATRYIRDLGGRVLERHGAGALVALLSEEQLQACRDSGLFGMVSSRAISREHFEKLHQSQLDAVRLWSFAEGPEHRLARAARPNRGLKWNAKGMDAPGPRIIGDPERFKALVHTQLKTDRLKLETGIAQLAVKPVRLLDKGFQDFEKKLNTRYKNPGVASATARMAWALGPLYQNAILALDPALLHSFFGAAAEECWEMKNEISVGVVFVESSQAGGPKFTDAQRNTLRARISDGLSWLAGQAPASAHLTWVYDWQFISIAVANGTNNSEEDYWRNPAMGQVRYNDKSFDASWAGVGAYREEMRSKNDSAHAMVIFVTPFATEWHAYAGGSRVTLANRNNWGGWGIDCIDEITAHEACHLFGADDEYTGAGTPCSSCAVTGGCENIPNGNCGACAKPLQDCIMDANSRRICGYTRGQIGWSDLFVELTTADEAWAGTDDTVWLDIGDQTFELDSANHNDRERGNVEGYAISAAGITRNDVKRVGIRKSSDGTAGGWKLKRVRLWCQGELVCDADNINKWLEDDTRWWASSTCGSSNTIVNTLSVKVTTANEAWAGTDDTVYLYMGGRRWTLDRSGRNDFERGNTDTFELDPGTGLYRSMLGSLRIRKSGDGVAGGWKLKGLQIIVNGQSIYNNQGINKWLEDDDLNWNGNI